MFYTGASCDIYIGKGAGKELIRDIKRAKKSVKIISPYLSPFLISELIQLKKRDLDIELITTDRIEDFKGNHEKNIYQLIIQNKETNQEAINRIKKWKYISRVLMIINFILLLILFLSGYFFKDINVAFGFIPVVILWLVIKLYRKKIKTERVYTYWYSQLFPFKVFLSPYSTGYSDTFIHSKIYLIDDKIVYLGSLNFTSSGILKNYETRIRSTDSMLINEINKEFYHLMKGSLIPELDIQLWGSQLYMEPIN